MREEHVRHFEKRIRGNTGGAPWEEKGRRGLRSAGKRRGGAQGEAGVWLLGIYQIGIPVM
jgi:hypothetical protein